MTALLLKLFIKNHDADTPAVRAAVGKLAGITGIVCNILLFIGKLLTGLLAGSVSIVADAANNLSDASSSVVTLLAFRMSQKPADKDHPYGHARYEYLAGLAVAGLILFIGVQLAINSVKKILHPVSVALSGISFAVLLGSVIVKLWMSLFYRTLGKRIRSVTLQATSVDCRNDVIASAAVFVGCLIEYLFHINIDGIVGLVVAVFILYSGCKIVRETVSPLLGKQADDDLVEHLNQLVLSHEKILGLHDLLVHDYGPGRCFASVHAELSAEDDALICHDIIDAIEREALETLNVHLVIHYDPVQVNNAEWNDMRQTLIDIIHVIDKRLSIHDFRIVRDSETSKLIFDLAVPYSMNGHHEELKNRIDDALLAKGKSYVTVIRFDQKS